MDFYNNLFLKEFPEYYEVVENKMKNLIYVSKEEYKKTINIVENFIKEKGGIIYGGLAVNKLLPDNKKIYEDDDEQINDYDVYSPQPKRWAVELANKFFNEGFKYISVSSGVTAGVYKLFINFQSIVDFTFMPQKIFNLLPYEEIDGIKYEGPEKLKMDYYISLTNPRHALFRWLKDNSRLELLEEEFPVIDPGPICNIVNEKDSYINLKTLQKLIKDNIDNNPEVIITGDIAYLFYMRNSGLESFHRPNVKYLEVMTKNPIKLLKNVKRLLHAEIIVKEYDQFLLHIPKRYIVSLRNSPQTILLIIYDLNEKCVPYINVKNNKFISFDSLILFYNFMIYLSKLYNIMDQTNNSKCCIYYLMKGRKNYLKISEKTKLDGGIFKSFITYCDGNSIDLLRESKKKSWENPRDRFRYIPGKREHLVLPERVDIGGVKNISGEYSKEIFL